MKIGNIIKEISRKILINRFINNKLVQPLIKIKRFLPFSIISRLPVIGTFSFSNKSGKVFKLKSDGYDPTVNMVYWTDGTGYEPGIINLLHSILKKSEILIDVGANTGIITIQMSLLPFAKEVHSFEPLPRAFLALEQHIRLNSLKNCYPYQFAIGKENSITKLYVPNVQAIPTASSLDPNKYIDNHPIEVNTKTLDSFVKENNVSNIDVIKIDVEGRESDVLSGMKNVLQEMKPYIVCEILPRIGDVFAVYSYVKPYNYYLYEIRDNEISIIDHPEIYQRTKCRDFLLSPEQLDKQSTR
jgi:FkbM family methyltransferase